MRADGTLDPTFHPEAHYSIDALASDAAGNVYAGGTFMRIDSVAHRHLAKLDGASGAVDPDWDPSPNGDIKALAVDADGDIFVAGNFTEIGGETRSLTVSRGSPLTATARMMWDGILR